MFDLIAGLPLHPLIDHVVVIAIPATVLLALFMLLAGKGSKSFTYWLVGLSAVSFAAALIAKFSGEALSERVGMPLAHAQDGDRLVYAAGALFASVVVYSLFALKIVKLKNPPKMNLVLPRAFAGLGLVPVLALTYVAGHSGAEAVWGSKINTATAELVGVGEMASAQPMAANVVQTTGRAAGQRTTTPGITPSEVAKHSSATSCWSSINGNVYDMTSYVNKHPGGAGVIKAICGKDGTQAFNGQHRGEGAPANVLTGLLVGPLQNAATQTAPVVPGAPKAPMVSGVPTTPGTPGRPTKPGSTSMTGLKSMPPAGAYGDEDDDDDDYEGEYEKDGRDYDDDDDEYEGEDHDDDDDEKSNIISRWLDRFFD